MSAGPVCPNGHDFPRATTVRCDECSAGVVCIPHSEGIRLHEALTKSEGALGEVALYAQKMIRSKDQRERILGQDVLDIIGMYE